MYATEPCCNAAVGSSCANGDPTSIKVVPNVISVSVINCSLLEKVACVFPVPPDSIYLTYNVI